MKALRLLTVLLLALTGVARAQVVTTNPAFFTAADPVTLTFNAAQGNQGLNNFTGDVYAHIGVITNLSTSPSDWRYVKFSNFNAADPSVLLTRTGANTYTLSITPSVRAWFNVPAAEQILKLAMVFRNATGTIVGRATGGADIFVDVAQSSALAVRITAPTTGQNPTFINSGTTVNVTGTVSQAATLTLRLNGTQISQQTNATSFSGSVTPTQAGRNVIRLTATVGTTSVSDSAIVYIRPAVTTAALPTGVRDGINYLAGGTSAVLVLTAPGKQFVYAIGEFNGWQPTTAGYMNKTPDGNQWWVQLNGLTAGQEYAFQYLVDGELRVADPYAEKILDPSNDQYIPAATYPNLKAYPTGQTTGIVSVLQPNAPTYTWTTTGYQRPAKSKLVVYELHLRDFIARHDYQTLIDTLGYLQRLGVNAIELMPVGEFEGNESWGYNPSFHMAPDKYYGPKNELKRFVDAAHARGMAVVLDMVLNHAFGQNPLVQLYFANGNVTSASPWFNVTPTHPYNVGYDFNHESTFTKAYCKRVMQYWLQEYRMDGYRFDLSKGFTQTNNPNDVPAWGRYDQSRINIWTDYNNYIQTVDPNAFVILEHFADNSEETVLAAAGMMLWGNLNHNYNEATMGWLNDSNFSWGYYGSTTQGGRGWAQPNLVTYMESHDEERLMYKNITYGNQSNPNHDTRTLPVALARQEAAAAFFFTVPGPKMVWQFGELGYDVSIDFNGRVGNKPIRWNYYQEPARRKLYDVYSSLIALKKSQAVFDNPTSYSQQLAGAAKSIHLSDAAQKVTVIGNFDVTSTTIDPAFQQTGKWYNYLTGDSITVSNVNAQLTLQPGEYRVYTTTRVRRPATVLASKAEQRVAALGLTVAPNPAAGRATVRLTAPTAAPVTVSVRNVIGREVRRVQLPARPAGAALEVPLTLDGLAAGVYIVNVQAGAASAATRLVVQP
ncbi:T9SS type A sorting domain-containing protein [Hymenobacter sp. 15J16-1T3B]|uniref:alpha-amylase family glycosyl hydrolase n=1 Tax=Hymenobacter sp. 15J16-1T3B TaxID=2886941 RepID=UPI001D1288F5|nr:alpha-amylase family glycosyl hydrolase [Hymenobacter sp. 15J16-1T3B]MCC3159297.1 T9SS type A sorting domain-containing protein [Hymenobacter sp. 15J16-1T3B]